MNKDLYNKVEALFYKGFKSLEISNILEISQRSAQRYLKAIKENAVKTPDYSGMFSNFGEKQDRVMKFIEDTLTPKFLWSNPPETFEKKIVGVIPDTHFPASRVDYLNWLIKVFQENGVNTIVHLGDLVDFHTISRHLKSPEADGTLKEYEDAKIFINKYKRIFPYVHYCWGNHCQRINKMAAENGIPKMFIKPYEDLFNIPDTWKLANEHIIDDVLYTHGTKWSGRNAITNINQTTMMSTVVGHMHTSAGVFYTNTGYKKVFTLCCGCLIDEEKYNFEYGLDNKLKPMLGCGIVKSSKEAYFIPYEE